MTGKTAKIILAALILGALGIRLAGIEWGLPSKTLTLASANPDEAFVFQSLENMYKTRSLHPKKIALHYGTFYFYSAGAILGAAKMLGLVSLGGREFLLENLARADRMYLILRFFSVFCGVLSVWGAYAVTKRIYDEKTGLWAAFFMAFSPIAIAVSHIAKLDALLPPLVLLLFWKTLDLIDIPASSNAWACGIVSGLIASTRYNCGSFILVPLIVIFLNRRNAPLSRLVPVIVGSMLAFIVTTPYVILDWRTFMAGMTHMESFVTTPTLPSIRDSRPYNLVYIFETMIPFAVSWPAAVFFVLGGFFCCKKRASLNENVMALGFVSFAAVFCLSSARYTHYLVPALPAVCFFSALGAVRLGRALPKAAAMAVLALVVVYQAGYAWAFAGLYRPPSPQEQAGEWISANVMPDDSFGMLRSYFWTPGILRQKTPPCVVMVGAGDLGEFDDGVLALERFKPAPSYFILSVLERWSARTFSIKDGKDYEGMIEKFLSGYDDVRAFEREPEIAGIRFWLREPPWDLRLLAPGLQIYKRKS